MNVSINSSLVLIFSLLFSTVRGQTLESFTVQQVNNSVKLDFTINQGNTCNGIDIYRSDDSLNFVLTGNIAGVCGSTDFDVSYSFTDENPVINLWNYYRIEMIMLGFSPVVGIRVYDMAKEGLQFFTGSPDHVSVYFPPHQGSSAAVSVHDINGRLLFSHAKLQGNHIPLESGLFTRGIYIVTLITDKDVRLTGRFIKL